MLRELEVIYELHCRCSFFSCGFVGFGFDFSDIPLLSSKFFCFVAVSLVDPSSGYSRSLERNLKAVSHYPTHLALLGTCCCCMVPAAVIFMLKICGLRFLPAVSVSSVALSSFQEHP